MSSNWGLKVVSNDGATVIIDGTSDMMKIVASGTLSVASFTSPLDPGATNSVNVATGLTYAPAGELYWNRATGQMIPSEYDINTISTISSVTYGTTLDWRFAYLNVVNTNQTQVFAQASSARGGATTIPAMTLRYYIFEEVAF